MISIPIFCVSLLHISSVVKGYVYDLEIILLFVLSEIWYNVILIYNNTL